MEIIFTTEEIVTREVAVVVPDGEPRPLAVAEARFWSGQYDSSSDADRRDEKIIGVRIAP